jgi:hypothetical protein
MSYINEFEVELEKKLNGSEDTAISTTATSAASSLTLRKLR